MVQERHNADAVGNSPRPSLVARPEPFGKGSAQGQVSTPR